MKKILARLICEFFRHRWIVFEPSSRNFGELEVWRCKRCKCEDIRPWGHDWSDSLCVVERR